MAGGIPPRGACPEERSDERARRNDATALCSSVAQLPRGCRQAPLLSRADEPGLFVLARDRGRGSVDARGDSEALRRLRLSVDGLS